MNILGYVIDYLPWITWIALPIVILILVVKAWSESSRLQPATVPATTQNRRYSPQVLEQLSGLIIGGEKLANDMRRSDFHVDQLGRYVREWLDSVENEVWEVLPDYAGYITAEQGDITEDEKMRYSGWGRGAASLRISVDRRLTRLREIRPQIQITDTEIECKDALQHVLVEERGHMNLTILKGYAGWPVTYPFHIRNTRPHSIDIIGYNVTILWDDTAVQRIEWRAPSAELSNGLLAHPPIKSDEAVPCLTILADTAYQLDVPVNMTQIPNWPKATPRWTARGVFKFRANKQTRDHTFNFNTDNYQFPNETWNEMRDHILGDGN